MKIIKKPELKEFRSIRILCKLDSIRMHVIDLGDVIELETNTRIFKSVCLTGSQCKLKM